MRTFWLSVVVLIGCTQHVVETDGGTSSSGARPPGSSCSDDLECGPDGLCDFDKCLALVSPQTECTPGDPSNDGCNSDAACLERIVDKKYLCVVAPTTDCPAGWMPNRGVFPEKGDICIPGFCRTSIDCIQTNVMNSCFLEHADDVVGRCHDEAAATPQTNLIYYDVEEGYPWGIPTEPTLSTDGTPPGGACHQGDECAAFRCECAGSVAAVLAAMCDKSMGAGKCADAATACEYALETTAGGNESCAPAN